MKKSRTNRSSGILDIANSVYDYLSSVKVALVVIVALAAALTYGTILESLYDTPTTQYFVYRSGWFRAILALLGVNIVCSAMSRYPWKLKHIPFLVAHLGIIILLLGSWITDRFGLDGTLRLDEGQSSSLVEVNEPTLILSDGTQARVYPIRWTPPEASFKKIEIPEYGIHVDGWIAHADSEVSFVPAPSGIPGVSPRPALRVKLEGGPMRASQSFWLWSGAENWRQIQAGPATLEIQIDGMPKASPASAKPGPKLIFQVLSDGGVQYEALSSEGKRKSGRIPNGLVKGFRFEPGWKGNVTLTVEEFLPHAEGRTSYHPSRIQYGNQAPPAAVHIRTEKGGADSEIWMGLGDRAVMMNQGKEIGISFLPKRVLLPFSIQLEKFKIDHYEGTRNPMEYSSEVRVLDSVDHVPPAGNVLISMNEPLKHRGVTFYQSSYEDAQPRPTVSIFSVNRDPGRAVKYIGSLLIVLGTISLFVRKYWKAWENKKSKHAAPSKNRPGEITL